MGGGCLRGKMEKGMKGSMRKMLSAEEEISTGPTAKSTQENGRMASNMVKVH